ncbi:UNKNOWN [Stylonychia lemnae]|uniref:Ankyrin repeat-containing protein n=1 Tax=Stylonychia lemnae TaxID=5949 RepID=A0A078ATU6_STYLE|nr:UNKNOWN [Stylonychia lemnae]|eukprot:CDW84657.1 UNKNOWN [Stylonychia lemnae]
MGKCVSTGKKAHFMSLSKKRFKPEKPPRGKKNRKGSKYDESISSVNDTPQKKSFSDSKPLVKLNFQQKQIMTFDPSLFVPQAIQSFHMKTQIEEDPEDFYEKAVKVYKLRQQLPEGLIPNLIEACQTGNVEQMKHYFSAYQIDIQQVKAQMENISVGNRTIQSDFLNLLHLAVYHNQLNILKIICENVPTLDIVYTGRIPSTSGLANESEISLQDDKRQNNKLLDTKKFQSDDKHFMASPTANIDPNGINSSSVNIQVSQARSLILFWALDKQQYPTLTYLWNFNKFKQTNWGIKNLEFMLLLANDLNENEVFEILLQPKPFSECLKTLSFVDAMDFIEDHVVNNRCVKEELKLKLLYASEMAPYSFIGALFHFTSVLEDAQDQEDITQNNQSFLNIEKQENDCETDIQFDEILELYHKLNEQYLKQIIRSSEVIERLQEIYQKAENFKIINDEQKQKLLGMIKFIQNFKRQVQINQH